MSVEIDFGKVVLSDKELKFLKALTVTGHKRLEKNEKMPPHLKELKFAELYMRTINGESVIIAAITDIGIRYMLYREEKAADRKKMSRRYWITTAIAIAALILSLAALLWQGYTWTYEIHRESAASSSSILQDGTPSVEEREEPQVKP